ncbi:MAG: bifunctional metallophosphatase/5'-nucleotidase [Polyangiaceae bacterium]|nr:bifunctional metallophosphatase/5'-nucleotidase [Polyangiaceae bacterium]
MAGTGGSGAVDVQLLAFNDFHGNLEALKSLTVVTQAKTDTLPEVTVEAGGGAFLAAHVAAQRAKNPNTLLVSAGDAVGGSPLASSLFHDEPTIELMNAMGLDVNGVGNHEFDEGSAELLRMVGGTCHPTDGCLFQLPGTPAPAYGGADYPILGANVVVEATGQTLLPPTHLREIGGVKIGFIGLTLKNTPSVVTTSAVAGLKFEDEIATVNKLVPGLKAQGAKAIVVLVHEGGVQTGLYNECVGLSGDLVPIVESLDAAVDVVVSGHTHRAYNCTVAGKLVTSALSAGRILTKIDLRIDPTAGVVSKSAQNIIVSRDVAPDPTAQGIIDVTLATAGPLARRVVGTITADLPNEEPADRVKKTGETILGDVIADAQLAATDGPNEGNAVIAFMNPGGIRAPILLAPGNDVAPGNVTYGALFTTQPFGNYLVTMTLTGAQIEMLLEQQIFPLNNLRGRVLQVSSGFTYSWSADDATDVATGKIDIDPATIKLNGVVLNPTGTYRITVNSFLAPGGDGFAVLKDGTDRLDGGDDLKALEDYFAAQPGALPTPTGDRITRLN